MSCSDNPITQQLFALKKKMDMRELYPTLEPGATDFALQNPYAFCLATCLDHGAKAEVIWTIPFYMHGQLGHLDPAIIYRFSLKQLGDLINSLPRKPRFTNTAPRTIQDLTRIVVEDCSGDATLIWEGRRARQVRDIFLSVYGVGPGIANMAVLLIENAFSVRFPDLDRPNMQIKPDVHTRRVLYRLGVALSETDPDALEAAKSLNPGFPGELDAPLWKIGRTWCHATNPNCQTCWMCDPCRRVGVRKK